jgi:SAM-dependent methyltransferase
MLRRNPLYEKGKLVEGDVRTLPFPPGSFDLVYGWEVLHHISDPGTVVAEMARVSRRYVLLAEPNRANPAQFGFALADREHRWVLRYGHGYLRRLIEGAGLKVLRIRTGGWVFPNKTPRWLLPLLKAMPYWFPLGITNWALGEKLSPAPQGAPPEGLVSDK